MKPSSIKLKHLGKKDKDEDMDQSVLFWNQKFDQSEEEEG